MDPASIFAKYAYKPSTTSKELKITPRANQQLRKIAEPGEYLRVNVNSGGCAGFEYKIFFDKNVNSAEDILIGDDNAKVVVDKISLDFIKGSTLDYTQEMMRSAFRILDNPLSTQGCSCGASFAPNFMSQKQSNDKSDEEQKDNKGSNGYCGAFAFPLLCLNWLVTVKDVLGLEKVVLDKDPIKDKLKQALLLRRQGKYTEAIEILHVALKEAFDTKIEDYVTRIYNELANTYYEQNDLENAEKLFRETIQRFHSKNIDNFNEERLAEVEEYMDEVIKIATHIYGGFSEQTITILNNIGAKCIMKQKFDLALKYLEIGTNRVLHVNDCAPLIVGYYCNYAEALFHSGQMKKALEIARKALLMAQSQEPRIRKHAENFCRQLEKDARHKGTVIDNGEQSFWRKWLPL